MVASERSVRVTWAGLTLEFFPNTRAGEYVLPTVDGETIDVDPRYTYQGPHLQATGRTPHEVITRWDSGDSGSGGGNTSYEVRYDFSTDTMTTRVVAGTPPQ
jgi:hypothetical protein